MHSTLNASIPQHLYGYVNYEILRGLEDRQGEFEPCVIFGVTSIPSRALHFSILLESGAQWARIPIHMLKHELPNPDVEQHVISDLQCWDSMGWDFSVVHYEYLREMTCKFFTPDKKMIPATYWFTVDHTDNGFSQFPSQHKCFHLLLLNDGSGQIAAMPNNRILWNDDSFVAPGKKLDYKVMANKTWHAEVSRVNPQDTALTKD